MASHLVIPPSVELSSVTGPAKLVLHLSDCTLVETCRCAGYYPKDGPRKSNLEAQIDMIDESLRWAGIDQATEVCLLLQCSLLTLTVCSVC